jgi:redox-sensitive bicupin YhaK (pirin superfamily)
MGEGAAKSYKKAGDEAALSTGKDTARAMLSSGKPSGEPMAWYGPIIMNTREELAKAYEELQGGTFIRKQAMLRTYDGTL